MMRPQGVLDGRVLGRVLIMGILHSDVAAGIARLGRRHWGNGRGLWLHAWVHADLVRIILVSGQRLLLRLDLTVVGVVSGGHGHLARAVVVSPGRAAGGRVGVRLPLLLHGCWQGEVPASQNGLRAVVRCIVWQWTLLRWLVSSSRERGGEGEGGLKLSNNDGLGSLAGGSRSQVWA